MHRIEVEQKGTYLRGAGRLTMDAIVGVIDIVESMHRRINTLGGLFAGGNLERTTGLTGFVYSNIRAVTNLVGGGLDAALESLEEEIGALEPAPGREALVAALNGVIGDYLAKSNNPLAITMQFRHQGEAASLEREALKEADGRVLLIIHGSSTTDLQWSRKGHDHGAALAEELGFVPLYLFYNSGRHISENGSDLSNLLEKLVEEFPEVKELTILSHSMGGLVSRSACHYGEKDQKSWRGLLKKIVFLATPHHGALLERSGNLVDTALQVSPYSAPFARLGKIRSAGVTDLRYGNVCHKDWEGRERFKYGPDRRCPVPLPDGVECYAVAATLGPGGGLLLDHIVGDGLVQLKSALGHHDDPEMELGIPESHCFVVPYTNHLDVLSSSEVYDTLKVWLKN